MGTNGTTSVTPATKSTSRLAGVKAGKLKEPLKMLLYGVPGVGKTTLAAHAPAPLWGDIEGGSGQVDVARYPFRDGAGGHIPLGYPDIIAMLDDLTTGDHSFQTLVLDTVDRLESMLWGWICKRDGMKNVDAYGYGKGFNAALDEWRVLLLKLERLQAAKGMAIILIGHSIVRTFKSPDTEDFDRYNLSLNDKAAGLLRDWVDVCGFACFEDVAGKGGSSRVRGVATGRRLLKLERTAAYDAKSRYPLPAEVEINPESPWAPFAAALAQGESMDATALAEAIAAEVTRIGDPDIGAKVEKAVAEAIAANDIDRLRRNLIALKRVEPRTENQQAA